MATKERLSRPSQGENRSEYAVREALLNTAEKLAQQRRNTLNREGVASYLRQWQELGLRIKNQDQPSNQLNKKQMLKVARLFLDAPKVQAIMVFCLDSDLETWKKNLILSAQTLDPRFRQNFWEWPNDLAREAHVEFNERERFWRKPVFEEK